MTATRIGTPAPRTEKRPAHPTVAEAIVACVGRDVDDLVIAIDADGVTLTGRVASYFVKQQVQHAVMRLAPYLRLTNRLDVTPRPAAH